MDRNTIDTPPAERWRQSSALHVRQRTPVHDAGTPCHAPDQPASPKDGSKSTRSIKEVKQPVMVAPPMAVQAAECVRIPLAATILGTTAKALERKIESGTLAQGKQFHRRAGDIYIDIPAYQKWVRTGN